MVFYVGRRKEIGFFPGKSGTWDLFEGEIRHNTISNLVMIIQRRARIPPLLMHIIEFGDDFKITNTTIICLTRTLVSDNKFLSFQS